MKISKINPDLYHGNNKTNNFFEGWYFKIADSENKHAIAIIPGIFKGTNLSDSHSFIQIVNGSDIKYSYVRFKENEFHSENPKFAISINDNFFSLDGMNILINDEECTIKGKIDFGNIKRWPDTFINPGSMGFFNYIPNLQCYSQVIAMDMALSGYLIINNEKVDFNGGRGYIEKNWGSNFPISWIWVQSNCFKNLKTSLTCSIGDVPFGLTRFNGFLIGLYSDDKFYSFTTINRSKVTVKYEGNDVKITAKNKKFSLNIEVHTDKGKFILCMGPKGISMIPLVKESLTGIIKIELRNNVTGEIILTDTGLSSGIEYGGEKMALI